MRAFWIAWQLLTRLPSPSVRFGAEAAGRSVAFYPAIGLIIGGILAGLHAVLAGADAWLAAALILAAWVSITGGLHLDGLADSADAWAGSHGDRRRALTIMKDARSGPAGVTAVVLVLLLKFAALAVLLRAGTGFALVAAPVLGRGAIVFLFLTTPYVRPRGLGAPQAAHLATGSASLALGIVVSGVALMLGAEGAWAVAAALAMALLLRHRMRRLLGGVTGDTLGASCEIMEALTLVVLALIR
jgi:adenosylcobinamide-GDP ribazoletransferase